MATVSVFDGALEHSPDDALLHFNRAVIFEELKRYDAAATTAACRHDECLTERVGMPVRASARLECDACA